MREPRSSKSLSFYRSNPLFWTKIGLFVTVAILSIPPTLRLIRWSKQVSRSYSSRFSSRAMARGMTFS
ncbi:MAG: DUF2214 family protein [Nitrospira sp.]|nr:DUF2214 family protein [Nitrospira sp.]